MPAPTEGTTRRIEERCMPAPNEGTTREIQAPGTWFPCTGVLPGGKRLRCSAVPRP